MKFFLASSAALQSVRWKKRINWSPRKHRKQCEDSLKPACKQTHRFILIASLRLNVAYEESAGALAELVRKEGKMWWQWGYQKFTA